MSRVVDGREFSCLRCGKCCRWPGYVFLTQDDICRLAQKFTEGDQADFLECYTKKVGPRSQIKSLALIDKADRDECIFLRGNECGIYEDRPAQCKEYPLSYDSMCPGFTEMKEVSAMSADMVQKIRDMNKKLSGDAGFEKVVSEKLYEGLRKEASSIAVTARALESGIGAFFEDERVKVASLDDLFAFNRVDDKHLIHKATRDLWAIEAEDNGNVHITRLFDSGKPVKG